MIIMRTCLVLVLISWFNGASFSNLTCYQCKRNSFEECSSEDLRPCDSRYDRCVVFAQKAPNKPLVVSRECGLAPCTFSDIDVGLGMEKCDRSKPEYFCISCCKENGCNKNSSNKTKPSIYFFIAFLYIIKHF